MGSLLQVGDRWRAQVRRKGYKSIARTFTRKMEARAWITKIEAEMGLGSHEEPGRLKGQTLASLIDWYGTTSAASEKEIGRSKRDSLAMWKKKHGGAQLAAIDQTWIVEWAQTRAAGPATVSVDLSFLQSVFRLARAMGKLPKGFDPIGQAREPLKLLRLVGKSKERDRRFTDDEVKRLVEHFAATGSTVPMGDMLLFALSTAMRAGEIVRIRWADLNEHDRTVIIRDRKDPEEKAGNDQEVPLLTLRGIDAFEIVQRQPHTSDRIFPWSRGSISTLFPRACALLGIKGLRFHDSRHEAISRLFEAGYRVEQVALISGHRDWKQLKRYTNLKAKDLHR